MSNRIEVAERRAEALKLRTKGATYREIAARLGYTSEGAASKDVHRALKLVVIEPGRELLKLEAGRTDELLRIAFELAKSGDTKAAVRAIDAGTRILARRAAMFGLDKRGSAGPEPAEGRSLVGDLFDLLGQSVEHEDAREAAAPTPTDDNE